MTSIPIYSVAEKPCLISAISSAAEADPGARNNVVGVGDGGDEEPRAAWPVGTRPSWRADRCSSSHVVRTPSATMSRRVVAIPSPSNGFERRPRDLEQLSLALRSIGNITADVTEPEARLLNDV